MRLSTWATGGGGYLDIFFIISHFLSQDSPPRPLLQARECSGAHHSADVTRAHGQQRYAPYLEYLV